MTAERRDSDADRDAARAAGRVAKRAIWRLNVLEWVILLAAVALATGGGWLVAPLLEELLGVPFRWAWAGLSLFLFVVPGAIVLLRDRREERVQAARRTDEDRESDV